jgi:clan AA aspartic protease
MNGMVDVAGRSLIAVSLTAPNQSASVSLEAWVDTGFTGELVLPQTVIAALGLVQSGTVTGELGDGSTKVMNTYTCLIDWFGQKLQVEAIANHGHFPLLGVGLLRDHKLAIDYPARTLSIL